MARRIAPRLVRDVMSSQPKTVGPTMPVRELQGFFASYDYNAFPVVEGAGILVGIVSRGDVIRSLIFENDKAN
jgi:CBS domain-containing protein